jgi:hypothetical protein
VTFAVEGAVLLRLQPAFSMSTIGGEGDEFVAFADDKETEVSKSVI